MSLLVNNIGQLVTNDPDLGDGSPLGMLDNAALVIVNGQVVWVGGVRDASAADQMIDVGGRAVIPGFVDSHSHLVFAGDRAAEFAARMAGETYTGGGIKNTVKATREASDEELRANLTRLRSEALRQGTTTMEIKSGYGLTVEDEVRILKLAREVTEETTFLGAHVVPPEYSNRPDEYTRFVVREMLPVAAPYARWIDVFCEQGAFTVDQARTVLTAGISAGLLPRIHANQLTAGRGVRLAVELGAASADHCTHLTDADIDALAGSTTVATLLPGAEFSTRSAYPDARRLLKAGVSLALATDCNPGSSYTSSMSLCIALAVCEMRMTPAEALWAATAGGAKALLRRDVGHLGLGARADLSILDAPSYVHLAYRPGVPLIHQVLSDGVPQ